jgi:hypothetical protein
VSATIDSVVPSQAGEPAAAASEPIFKAFQERKASRLRWAWLAVPLVVLGGGGWLLSRGGAAELQVMTRKGTMTVRRGMTPGQVGDILGKPLAQEPSADGRDCYRYGQPTMPTKEEPTFRIFSACYEDGVLRDVKVHHYEAWDMDAAGLPRPPDAPAPTK